MKEPEPEWAYQKLITSQVQNFFDQTPQLLFVSLLVLVWLLFEGDVYFIWKLADSNND